MRATHIPISLVQSFVNGRVPCFGHPSHGNAGSRDRFDDYIIDFAIGCRRRGERIAIVTLVKIAGSS